MFKDLAHEKSILRMIDGSPTATGFIFEATLREKRVDGLLDTINGLFAKLEHNSPLAFLTANNALGTSHYFVANTTATGDNSYLYNDKGRKLGGVHVPIRYDEAIGFLGDDGYIVFKRLDGQFTIIYGDGKFGVNVGGESYVDFTPNADCNHPLNHLVTVRSPDLLCHAMNLRDELEEYRERLRTEIAAYEARGEEVPTDINSIVNCEMNIIGVGVNLVKGVIVHNSSIGDCTTVLDDAYIVNSRIGINSMINSDVTIKSSHTGEDCYVRNYTSIYKSHLEESVDIGDCCILQKAYIGKHCDIGNNCDLIQVTLHQNLPPYTHVGNNTHNIDPAFIQVVPMIVDNSLGHMVLFWEQKTKGIWVQYDGDLYTLPAFVEAVTFQSGLSGGQAEMFLSRLTEIGEKVQLIDMTAKTAGSAWPDLWPVVGSKGDMRHCVQRVYSMITQADEDYAIKTLAGQTLEPTDAIKTARTYLLKHRLEWMVISLTSKRGLMIGFNDVYLVELDSACDYLIRNNYVFNVDREFVVNYHVAMFPVLIFPGAQVKRFMVVTEPDLGTSVRIMELTATIGQNDIMNHRNLTDMLRHGAVIYEHNHSIAPEHFEAATGGLVQAQNFKMPMVRTTFGNHIGKSDVDWLKEVNEAVSR